MRFSPLSYFCTCWKERPSAAPSFSWLIASILRRMRTRRPTCWSVGLGAVLLPTVMRGAMADRLLKLLSKNRIDCLEYRWLYPFVMSQFLDEGLCARVF